MAKAAVKKTVNENTPQNMWNQLKKSKSKINYYVLNVFESLKLVAFGKKNLKSFLVDGTSKARLILFKIDAIDASSNIQSQRVIYIFLYFYIFVEFVFIFFFI